MLANILVLLAGMILIGAGAGIGVMRESKRTILFMGAAGVLIILFSACFTVIPTGYTGVRTVFGQIKEQPVDQGFNLKLPLVESIKKVNNKQQDIKFEGQIWSETAERTAVYYEAVTVTYQISREGSAWICANVSDYKKSLITQPLIASAVKMSSKVLSDTDATDRGKIEPLAMENIQKSLDEKYGEGTIRINKVVIGEADFEETYNAAIAEKQNAQLAYERQQIENQKAVEKAEAEAEARVKEAEGNAEAKRISSEAEANANRILADSLSQDIFTQMMLDKWNGELPKVVGESGTVLDIGGVLGTAE